MKKQFLLTLALASLNALLLAQSPPPPPAPTKPGQEKQDIGSVEKSPTQNAATPSQTLKSTINKTSAEPDQANKSGKPAKRGKIASSKWNWSAINTGIVTFFTFILTGVGVFQYISMRKQGDYMRRQADYMRRGLPVSINAAKSARFNAIAAQNAVKLAESNAAKTERAVILLDSVEVSASLGAPDLRDWPLNHLTILIFTFKNYGNTVAHNVEVTGKVTLLEEFELELLGGHHMTIAPQGTNQWITSSFGKILHGVPQYQKLNDVRDANALTYRIEVLYDSIFTPGHSYLVDGQYIGLIKRFITGNSTST